MQGLEFLQSKEVFYIGLLFALFVIPRFLQRFRIPSAITCMALGCLGGLTAKALESDTTVPLLATFGIVSLFVFAGLEVNVRELLEGSKVLLQHLVSRVLILGGTAVLLHEVLGLSVRGSALFALALLTPSAGFILDSIDRQNLDVAERFWVKTKAIATELIALLTLFIVLQSSSVPRFLAGTGALAVLVLLLPVLFRMFAAFIVPHAPRSEFAFLLMLGVVAAFITKLLGVYYLVGAFLVGLTARLFRQRMPAMTSEEMLHAVEVFASLFVPFYFFQAGTHLRPETFSGAAIVLGILFLVLVLPLRVVSVMVHRRLVLKERWRRGLRISSSLFPTLVFTLVVAEILHDQFELPPHLFGALVIYAVGNTLLPPLILRLAPPAFDAPHLPPIEEDLEAEG